MALNLFDSKYAGGGVILAFPFAQENQNIVESCIKK